MNSTQSPSIRPFVALLITVLSLAGVAILYWTRSGQAGPAVPRVDEVTRVRIRLDFPLTAPQKPLPPPFDAPPAHFAAILDRMNGAKVIPRPHTSLTIGYVEAWYRDGVGVRLELFLAPSKDAVLTSKDLIFSTPDGVWRSDGKFVDFAADVRSAYRDLKTEAEGR